MSAQTPLGRLVHGARTHVGLVRQVNEDSLLAQPPLYVVADGMGGHQGGAVASSIVVDEFSRLDPSGQDTDEVAEALLQTMTRCQTRIREWGETQGDPSAWRAGTTVVAAVAVSEGTQVTWVLANLGDSRIYRVVGDTVEQVTKDHSVVQQLVDSGRITAEEALTHPERHVITKALGSPELVQPDFFLLPGESVQRLVLCSDGVSGMITDPEMASVLARHQDPERAADELVAAALAAGGRDNATAIVVDVVGLTPDDTDTVQRSTGPETLGALP